MRSHSLLNFEIVKYDQNKPKLNGAYSRNTLKTHWIALYVNSDNVTYFDSFGVEHISKEMKKFIGNKKYQKYLQDPSK